MSLLGLGAVAIWHDVALEGRADFYAWHGQEHMPERVGIPGFRRGRRYVAFDADLEFFNLYEADSPAALTGENYKARLNSPTPWTQATVKHFRNVARSLCRVAYSHGDAQGGLVATWRYEASALEPGKQESEAHDLLRTIRLSGGVAGAHLLVADAQASSVINAEERARGQRNEIPGSVLLVEGWGDVLAFAESCRSVISPEVSKVAKDSQFGIYQLQATVSETDVK